MTPTIPPRVDYALTALGTSLRRPIDEMTVWALANHGAIVSARELNDATVDVLASR